MQQEPDMKVSMSNISAPPTPPKRDSKRNLTQVKTADLKRMRKCKDPSTRTLIIAAAKAGFRYRMTNAGVIFYGNQGSITVHLTESDKRSTANTKARFKAIGFEA